MAGGKHPNTSLLPTEMKKINTTRKEISLKTTTQDTRTIIMIKTTTHIQESPTEVEVGEEEEGGTIISIMRKGKRMKRRKKKIRLGE